MSGCVCGADPRTSDLGIQVEGTYDGILIWGCGQCGAWRPRFDPPDRRHDLALTIIGPNTTAGTGAGS